MWFEIKKYEQTPIKLKKKITEHCIGYWVLFFLPLIITDTAVSHLITVVSLSVCVCV